MSDQSALVTKLQALADDDATFVGSARVISMAGVPAPMTAVLAEIDNAVLERTFVFDIDGVMLRMSVAGRRLRGLVDIAGVPPTAKALTGKVLSQDDPSTTKALGTLLLDLCKDAKQITIQAQPAEPLGNPSEAGIPVAGLASLWQVAETAAPQSRMIRFLSVNAAAITAYIVAVDGEISNTQGETAQLDMIWRDQFGPFRKRQKSIFPRQESPLLVCLDHALGDGRAAAIAVVGDEASVFAYDPPAISAILASWRMITK
ncbi:hypothetical protein [Yoonia vestfoldensis]|uniref:hypothetical protein n=1 Tax=Yoonia vestfoldensis TaxID=245188 RepID=UPI001FE1F618|nr:hypothetical protein [Yoonia vestfoldensis]